MRPQLGSRPKMADLTREEPTTDLAMHSASASVAAPVTSHSISTVAPSPSHAMHLASACSSTVSASPSSLASGLAGSEMIGLPAAPLARPSTQSFVEVSPSTVIWLKLLTEAVRTRDRQRDVSTAASHVTTPSMVAMLGWIMPDPLEQPPMLTSTPPRLILRAADLEARSVVVMAVAAARPEASSSPSAAASEGSAASISVILMRLPMTPVDSSMMSLGSTPITLPIASALARVSSQPCWPVAALACPALISTARTVSFSAMTCLQYVTGAAHMTLWVKVPPTVAGVSLTNRARSGRLPVDLSPAYRPAALNPLGVHTPPDSSTVHGPSGMRMGDLGISSAPTQP
mmetsp:Transcript_25671/g.48671  ORF Transcript_25671/g.48671 Transcript_25671/m.48671 type:complete len:345 (+) Transcript_25671:524-1558(+)